MELITEKRLLKNPDILKQKPHLKICSNHRIGVKTDKDTCRWWQSKKMGTAISDGKGWYIPV